MSIFLPTAERRTFRGKSGSIPRRRDAPSRIVIHTTETNQLPGYRNGGSAPHFTIGVGHPGSLTREPLGAVRVWQHISLDRTALSLRHPPGTPETNHMGAHCVQIECVTYIGDQPAHGIVGNKGKLPEPLSRALAGLVREIVAELGDININEFPDLWSASKSHGENARQRMTDKEWESFNGICGHEHVPHNTHWDPGAFDIKSFVELLRGESAGSGATPSLGPASETVDWPFLLERGDRSDRVEVVRGTLQILGYGSFDPSELYSDKVVDAVIRFQKAERILVDGIWGPQTHSHARARIEAELVR